MKVVFDTSHPIHAQNVPTNKAVPVLWLCWIYLASFGFDAVLRFGLSSVGLSTLLYVRELVPPIVIVSAVCMWVQRDLRFNSIFFVLYILCIHAVVGLFYTSGFAQVSFGFKVLSSVFVGLFIGCVSRDNLLFGWRSAYILLLISTVGVFINYFFSFPWGGGEFSSAFGTVTLAKDWSMDGVRRLAGFARASYDAASVIGALMVLVLSYSRRFGLQFLAAILALVAIFMTTTKGAALSGVIVVGVWLAQLVFKSTFVLRISLLSAAASVVAIPVCTVVLFPSSLSSGKTALLLSSFVDRMTYMWPMAMRNIEERGSLLFGRGLGGIGVPQFFGEWWMQNAADNLFVYGYSVFGAIIFYYLAVYLVAACRVEQSSRHANFVYLFGVFAFSYGVTANVFEQPILLSGLAASAMLALNERRKVAP